MSVWMTSSKQAEFLYLGIPTCIEVKNKISACYVKDILFNHSSFSDGTKKNLFLVIYYVILRIDIFRTQHQNSK